MVPLLEMKTFLCFHFLKLKLQEKLLGGGASPPSPPLVSATANTLLAANLYRHYHELQHNFVKSFAHLHIVFSFSHKMIFVSYSLNWTDFCRCNHLGPEFQAILDMY